MPKRSCECVKQIHITCALYASHAWWVHNFPRLRRTKFGLNMVSFVLLKKIYLAVMGCFMIRVRDQSHLRWKTMCFRYVWYKCFCIVGKWNSMFLKFCHGGIKYLWTIFMTGQRQSCSERTYHYIILYFDNLKTQYNEKKNTKTQLMAE